MNYYICDIDGTVADLSHRLHYIQGESKNWGAFFDACGDDKPITPVIETIKLLTANAQIIFITGRSDRVMGKTDWWLREQGLHYVWLAMRRDGDHRPDSIVKSEMLDLVIETLDGKPILGVFEDRKQVVDMYRKRGLTVFQVADGDF